MEEHKSNILGIPTALIFFVLFLAIFIDGFIYFFIYMPLRAEIFNTAIIRVEKVLVTPAPTATPSATVIPTAGVKSVIGPQVKTVSPVISR